MDAATTANLVLAVVAIVVTVGAAIHARRSLNEAKAIALHDRVGRVWTPTFRLLQTIGQGGLEAQVAKLQAAGRQEDADQLVRERLRPFLERLEDGLALHPKARFPEAHVLRDEMRLIDDTLNGAEVLGSVRDAATRALRQVEAFSAAHPSGDLGEDDGKP